MFYNMQSLIPSAKSNKIVLNPKVHQSEDITNTYLVRVTIGLGLWIELRFNFVH